MAANTAVNTFAVSSSFAAAPRRGRVVASGALTPAAAGRPAAVALRAGRQVRRQPLRGAGTVQSRIGTTTCAAPAV